MRDLSFSPPVHIVFPFASWASEGGARMRALGMYEALRQQMRVELWTEQTPDPALSAYPIQCIQPFRGQMPRGGTLLFVGMGMLPGPWYDYAAPQRVIVECTMFAPEKLYRLVNRLALGGRVQVELHYCSSMVRKLCALPGVVHHALFGLQPFLDVRRDHDQARFTLGRMSRDHREKHHWRDPALYRSLAQSGMAVQVVGGRCLAPWLPGVDGVELLPEMPQAELPTFLAGLDCFFYRTAMHALEGWGNVVIQAMAAGLPVVCYQGGGYAEAIRHGENGFLFRTDDEAREILRLLQGDARLARQVGQQARMTISAMAGLPAMAL